MVARDAPSATGHSVLTGSASGTTDLPPRGLRRGSAFHGAEPSAEAPRTDDGPRSVPAIVPGDGEASYPVLPLRDIVVFPHMIVPLFVGREKSIRALEEVMKAGKQILLAAPRRTPATTIPRLTPYMKSARLLPCCSC